MQVDFAPASLAGAKFASAYSCVARLAALMSRQPGDIRGRKLYAVVGGKGVAKHHLLAASMPAAAGRPKRLASGLDQHQKAMTAARAAADA